MSHWKRSVRPLARAASSSYRSRIDLGLIVKDVAPQGRLEASGRFNAMFTHRVKVAGAADIDDDLRAWVRRAYDLAG